ncbi:hypothetical protein Pogu_2177 [Pyrobaculum oguniense TE7]|uniref:Uncharacterized protein n=1 Tax=Pyrobaculum oguniense (strain DSM 13380 / JCM 10595 / TE7) TaxID=698757 RepID=H6QBC8_PYROT|nr:hypothetical protein Pogu_2177 [Pyrobaculum oguniense TE7]
MELEALLKLREGFHLKIGAVLVLAKFLTVWTQHLTCTAQPSHPTACLLWVSP